MPEQVAMPAVEQERLPILRPESLAMSGVERLREAASNFAYVKRDIGCVNNFSHHHFDTTPVHEAGHAIADTLAGFSVRDVYWRLYPDRRGIGGKCRRVGDTEYCTVEERIEHLGFGWGPLKELVTVYAGPVAELRYDPRLVFSGMRADMDYNIEIALLLEEYRMYSTGNALSWAWARACHMFTDDRVWAATIELADRLKRSRPFVKRVSGGAVRSIVRKHLDDWTWSDPPPRMRQRSVAA